LSQIQSDILHNIEVIQSRIRQACEKSSREASSVKLCLATKTVDPSRIRMAIEAGHTLIGENKVQEFASKADELSDLDYERHFIGHLQSKKVMEQFADVEAKVTVIGHLQRGGAPSCQDRVLSSRLGYAAIYGLMNGETGCMAGVINNKVIFTPIKDAIVQQKELNDDFIKLAKILAI